MRVLTVAAHPDDEMLGAGGTMAWHAARGDMVWVIVLADGASSRHNKVDQHAERARRACDTLGVERLVMVGLPDQRLDTLSLLDVLTPIEEVIDELQPDVVLTHFMGDVNEDHRLVARATMVPPPGARDPCAGLRLRDPFVDGLGAADTGQRVCPQPLRRRQQHPRREAIRDEVLRRGRRQRGTPVPHPRSLEALTANAHRHGAASGLLAAEAFMILASPRAAAWRTLRRAGGIAMTRSLVDRAVARPLSRRSARCSWRLPCSYG